MKKKNEEFDTSKCETVSMDEWMKEMDEWEANRPRILKWIDSWNGGRLLGSRPTYTLSHPWEGAEEIGRQIHWAWQRIVRGWDDRVCWSIDHHLSRIIPQWVRQLKEVRHGVPSVMFEESDLLKDGNVSNRSLEKRGKEYDIILEKIAVGFESYSKMSDEQYKSEKYKELEEKFNIGFDLFRKYYSTFWD